MLSLIKELSLLDGPSGREERVRDYIIERLPSDCEYHVDNIGNLIVKKQGKKRPKNVVMLASHMDEVGMIVTDVTDGGFIRFAKVGGIETSALVGKRVKVGENGLPGVIGVTAVHLRPEKDKRRYPEKSSLYIDCGVCSKDELDGLVSPGDMITFDSDIVESDRCLKGKALDDRAGCAVLLTMLRGELEYDTVFAFTVQEEVGLRGAGCAAFGVRPDYAVIVETTTASDISGVSGDKEVCHLGCGAVVPFMDRTTVYDRSLFKKAFELAETEGFRVQTKSVVAGGNDSGSIHKSVGGVKTLTVSFACRYLHSPSCVIAKSDIEDVYKAVVAVSGYMANA